eukprot:TRINITY_DN59906_c0_g1_i1.p2 TRINITY_DN59906_c0_g1~~TRINITY_DN59906_c0_g1_i1.p2  ORF type:complete len:849 (+),score=361.06 TRINITY_DN59906_c0_g1_i1:83-2548(+)
MGERGLAPAAGFEERDGRRTYLLPLSGAYNESPPCYLLELGKSKDHATGEWSVGGYNILLDCGWGDDFSLDGVKLMVDTCRQRTVDCILLSGPGLYQLGALPYLLAQLGRSVPVYATSPVAQMGLIALYDAHGYRNERVGSAPFTEEQMNSAFSRISKLKFFEVHRLQSKTGESADIFISPQPAGFMLGACTWHIVRDSDEVVYAPAFNHKRERHLPGADLAVFSKATVCIASCLSAEDPPPPGDRDQILLDTVMATLRRDGNVLIPCDITGRVLEVLGIIEAYWTDKFGDDASSPYNLVFLSEYAECTVAMAEQALEFMSDVARKVFESKGFHPMAFLQRGVVKFCRTREEMDELVGPKVVFATPSSMSTGFSQDLLLEWGPDSNNTVMLTERTQRDTVARRLLHSAVLSRSGGEPEPLLISVQQQVPLDEAELQQWREKELRRLQQEAEERRGERRTVREILEDELRVDSDEDDDSGDGEQQRKKAAPAPEAAETTEELFLPKGLAYKTLYPMFPCLDPERHDLFAEEYGAPVDEEVMKKLKRVGDDLAQEVLAELQAKDEGDDRGEGDEKGLFGAGFKKLPRSLDELEPPKKYVSNLVHMTVRAKIVTEALYDGRADAETLKHLLSTQCPHAQEMVLVNGTPSGLRDVAQACSLHSPATVLLPKVGERTDITSSTSMYRIRVGDELFRELEFTNTGEYKVAVVEGIIDDNEAGVPAAKRQRVEMRSQLPLLRQCQADEQLGGHRAVFIGDLALRDLSAQLKAHGWRAEFKKGCLIVGIRDSGSVVVRRANRGVLAVGGVLSLEWYKFRDRLRGHFKVL